MKKILKITHQKKTPLLKLSNEFNKIAEYKVSSQKSVAFLYVNNEQCEEEIMKTIPFIIASERVKYFGINKQVKYLYN